MDPGASPALVAGMLALAAGGVPHCAAMCGVPCAPWIGGRSVAQTSAFLGARLLSYALAGAVLAGGAAHLQQAAVVSRLAQPLWLAWHLLALGWGLVMLVRGEQPALVLRLAQPRANLQGATAGWQTLTLARSGRQRGLFATLAAGLAWIAWPCGLLHSALLLASLADSAPGGAALMAMFAATTSAGLLLAPTLWRRLAGRQHTMLRMAGAVLVASSAWAMAQQTGFVAWCLSPG